VRSGEKKWTRFLAFDVIIRYDRTRERSYRLKLAAQGSAGLGLTFYLLSYLYLGGGGGGEGRDSTNASHVPRTRASRALLCLLTERTMSEGGRAVIWLLVSALRAARHPEDSRTNRPLGRAPKVCRNHPPVEGCIVYRTA